MTSLIPNYPYFVSLVLFAMGIIIILTRRNLMKKILGLNIMETSVFLFFVALGNVRDGRVPVIDLEGAEEVLYVNPLPSVLILTGIVVSVSVTTLALSLAVKLHRFYGTLDMEEILAMESSRRQEGTSDG